MTTRFDKLLEDFLAAQDESNENPAIRSLKRRLEQNRTRQERLDSRIERAEEEVKRLKDDKQDLVDDEDELEADIAKEVGEEVM